jgi:hypothetical protein
MYGNSVQLYKRGSRKANQSDGFSITCFSVYSATTQSACGEILVSEMIHIHKNRAKNDDDSQIFMSVIDVEKLCAAAAPKESRIPANMLCIM